MSARESSPDDAGRAAERGTLRPVERIEDYAVVVAHVRALGGVEVALAALGVAPEEWAKASRWSSAMTRETLDGRTELASAFGAVYTAEIKAIAARAEGAAKAAAAAAEPPPPDPPGGPTLLRASNAAAGDAAASAPSVPVRAAELWPPPPPSFLAPRANAIVEKPAPPIASPPSVDETLPFKPGGPARAPLPFAPATTHEAPAAREVGAIEELTDRDIVDGEVVDELTMDTFDAATTLDSGLPFAASPEDDAPTARFKPLPPLEEDERALPLPLDRYASLCASLDVHRDDHVAVLGQFNVAGPEHLAAIHDAFGGAFARDPHLYTTFRAWHAEFIARLRGRG